MMQFVGRRMEMERLERELARVREGGGGGLVWLRGRRRVGKSRLVQEFCSASNVPYCFFQAPRRPGPEARAAFTEAVRASGLPAGGRMEGVSYTSWPALLRDAAHDATPATPSVIVIDELPYLCEQDPGFSADLQAVWDRDWQEAPVLVICIGSDVRMMDELVRATSPLHGRPTLELHLSGLDPRTVGHITGATNATEAIDRYLIVGGFPLLAATWSAGTDMEAFLDTALTDDLTPLATTGGRILGAEIAGASPMRRVIEVIGHGETANKTIQSRTGVDAATLSDTLTVLGQDQKALITRALPYAAPPGRTPPRYTVTDPYLRFWLRFVGPHMEELSRGRGDLVVARIMRDWATYRGRAVEPLVRSAIERLLADPARSAGMGGARHCGSWWKRDHTMEVDLVGGDDPRSPSGIGFIGAVKWLEQAPWDGEVLAHLTAARAIVPGAAGAKLVGVSRTGFAPGVRLDWALGPEDVLAAW